MSWIYYFIPGCLVTMIIGRYLREAFKAENMVNVDPAMQLLIGTHKQYMVYDKHGKSVLVPLPKGVLLSLYVVITSLAALAMMITAVFVVDKWWLPIVLYIGCELLIRIPSVFTNLSYGSFLYYVYLLCSPILIVMTFLTMFQ